MRRIEQHGRKNIDNAIHLTTFKSRVHSYDYTKRC